MIKSFEAVAENGMIRLPVGIPASARCVVTVLNEDADTLRQHSQFELPESQQTRMSDLLLKNRDGSLTNEERQELDLLSQEFDSATLAKGRALAALANLGEGSTAE